MPVPSGGDWAALERSLAGKLLLPGMDAYEWARRPFIARFDEVVPRAVVCCAAPADVAETLALAGRFGLETAVRSGGHDLAGRSSTSGVLLDLSPLDAVDVRDGAVTVAAGARTGHLSEQLFARGLAIPTGTCPTVGIGGLTLGGGFGILGRAHGLTLDRLLAAEVVLADGRIVTCDRDRHPDLFWALRGAGAGRFGVATEFTFDALRAPDTTTSFHLVWPDAQAAAVVAAWQRWSPPGPDALAADLALSVGADEPEGPSVEVFGAALECRTRTEQLIANLVDGVGSEPFSTELRELSYLDTCRFQADLSVAYDLIERNGEEERRRQGHRFTCSEFFAQPLPGKAIAALVDTLTAGRVAGQSRAISFAAWGGAYNRSPADATAFVHRDQLFLVEHLASVDPAAPATAKRSANEWTRRSVAAGHAWGSGRVYPAFPDSGLRDWEQAYYGQHAPRLRRIKAAYDPDNRLRGTQSIPLP